MTTVNLGRIKPIYKGAYSAGTAYVPLDMVQYAGNMYQCIANTTGNLPTSTTYFVAVVDVNTWSSTLPAADKIPRAGSDGRLDSSWLQRKPALKPNLSVDWTLKPTAASLIAAGWTISRASDMTYFGPNPVKVAENMLIESRTFGANWDKSSRPVTLTSVTHTSGLQGFNMAATAAAGAHSMGKAFTEVTYFHGQSYRIRFLVKAGAYTKCQVFDSSQSRGFARFDLATGAVIASTGGAGYTSHSITPHELGGGLYWCELVLVAAAAGTFTPNLSGYPDSVTPTGTDIPSFTGDGTSGIEVYAAQLQQGFDGDFVETTTTPVTQYATPLLTAASNELAYQHDANGECLGLLSYPTATNLCLHSQDFSNAAWAKSLVAATQTKRIWANSAPFWRLAKTDATSGKQVNQSCFTPGAGSTLSATVALLGDYWSNTTSVDLGLAGSENGLWGSDAETSAAILSGPGSLSKVLTGALHRVTGLSLTVPTLVRITRTYPLVESASRSVYIYPGTSQSTTIGSAILATRVQVELGVRSTPYIPTTSAAATRASQFVELGSTAFAALNNAMQGTLLTRASVEESIWDSVRSAARLYYATGSGAGAGIDSVAERSYIGAFSTTGAITSGVSALNSTSAAITVTGEILGAQPKTFALAYATDMFQLAANGATVAADTFGRVPMHTRLAVGNSAIASYWAGLIQRTELYPRAMTSAELIAITTPGVLV